jgi:hypothetical protein
VNQNLQNKSKIPLDKQGTKVRLDWTNGRDGILIWDEICIWAIEKFGMPGEKFTWHPTQDYMIFDFIDERDAIHFMLRWS